MGRSIQYMFRVIDRKDRRRYVLQTVLGLLGPVIDVFSISMLLPILSGMAEGKEDSNLLLKVVGIGVLLLVKTGFDLLLASAENAFRFVWEIICAEHDALEESEPYAVVTIQNLERAEHEVYDLMDEVAEALEKD